ncbi:MAG: ankyrin repeat domain-containing protein [Rhodospirillales bacterium]|nr:ankyrin repeat domain-containing protein [Rhodospirillales bacterium]
MADQRGNESGVETVGIRARILLAVLAAAVTVGGALAQDKKLSPATESLFLAIRTNNFDAVKRSLLAGADVEAEDEDGRTAIDIAVDRGRFNIAHYLLAWRKPAQARTPTTPAAPPPVFTETAPTAPVPETMPVTREPPSVLSPTPVQPVTAQPLAPTPAQPPVATASPPAAAPTPALPTRAQPAPAGPAPTTRIAPPAEAKQGGGFFDGVARFFGFGGGPEAKPADDAATAAAPATKAKPVPAPTPVAPLPTTGKIAPPAEVSQEEGFLESLARFFSGKSKTSPPPDDAAKPRSSLPTPTPAAEMTPAPAAPQRQPAAVATTNAGTTSAGVAPVRDSLLDHIAKVLADEQGANAPLTSAKPPAEPGPAAGNPPVAEPTPEPPPRFAAQPTRDAVPEPVVVPVKAPADEQPTGKTAKPGTSILDDIARMLSAATATSEPPPQTGPQTVAAAPVPAPVLSPDLAPSADPTPAAPAETETAAGNGDKGEFLGRVTEFFSVGPSRPQPSEAASATETAMAAAPKAAVAPPLRRTRAEPVLGDGHRLGMRRPLDSSGVCVDKSAAAFCVEPVDWPPAIAAAFEVQSAIYRGRQAIVRYDGGVATQFHALFPTANFQKIVDHFTAMLGPPGDTSERSAVAIGERNRKNRTARWLGPKAADGADSMLEVREIDDMRWSAPPDLEHGVVRLHRVGGDMMFQHVSWSDFLLARMRQPGN